MNEQLLFQGQLPLKCVVNDLCVSSQSTLCVRS